MQLIMYITLLNSQVYMCLGGRLIHLKIFFMWKLVICSTLVNFGQYVHFSNLVHTVLKICLFSVLMVGGKLIAALVSRSLRSGSLL